MVGWAVAHVNSACNRCVVSLGRSEVNTCKTRNCRKHVEYLDQYFTLRSIFIIRPFLLYHIYDYLRNTNTRAHYHSAEIVQARAVSNASQWTKYGTIRIVLFRLSLQRLRWSHAFAYSLLTHTYGRELGDLGPAFCIQCDFVPWMTTRR